MFFPQKYPFFPLPIILKFHKCAFDTSDFCTLSGPLLSSHALPPPQLCMHKSPVVQLFLPPAYSICPQISIYFPSLVLDPPSAKSIPLSLMKYLSGGLQLALQIFEEDIWLSRQFRPKKDIDHHETSSNHTQKNLLCVKTKLR